MREAVPSEVDERGWLSVRPRPWRRRVNTLWVTNAILEETHLLPDNRRQQQQQPTNNNKTDDDADSSNKVFLRPYTPKPLRLDWPVVMSGESAEEWERGRRPQDQHSPSEKKYRPPSSRFKRQRRPAEFKDGFDIYFPHQLSTIGDMRVSVLRRWMGLKRLCFWAWRINAMRRRPLVEKVKALTNRHRLGRSMKWWSRRLKADRHIGIRVKWYNHVIKAKAFEELYQHARGNRLCKILISRYYVLKFGQAFHRWVRAVNNMQRFDELITRSVIEKKRMVFRAVIVYGSRRARVKERAAKWLAKKQKLIKRLLVRWRSHTVDVITKERLIMSRFLPLKKKVFQALKQYGRVETAGAPQQRRGAKPIAVSKRRTSTEEVSDLLSRPGKPPAFISFKPLPPSQALAAISRKVAVYADPSLSSSTGGSNAKKKLLSGMSMRMRETSMLELGLATKKKPSVNRIHATEVFNFGGLKIMTDDTKLHDIEHKIDLEDRERRRAALLASGALTALGLAKTVMSSHITGSHAATSKGGGSSGGDDDAGDEDSRDDDGDASSPLPISGKTSADGRPLSVAELIAAAIENKRKALDGTSPHPRLPKRGDRVGRDAEDEWTPNGVRETLTETGRAAIAEQAATHRNDAASPKAVMAASPTAFGGATAALRSKTTKTAAVRISAATAIK